MLGAVLLNRLEGHIGYIMRKLTDKEVIQKLEINIIQLANMVNSYSNQLKLGDKVHTEDWTTAHFKHRLGGL